MLTTSCQMHPRLTVVHHFRVCSQQTMCSRTGCIWHDVVSKSVETHMAANCIAPILCEKKCCFSSYAGCGLHFLHIRRKKFHCSPTRPENIQNDWVHVPATTMMWRRCQPTLTYPPDFSKSLMVSTAVSKLGCSGLVFVAATTMMNCCCNDCCQRSASSVFKSMRFCTLFPCVFMHFFVRFRNKY